MSEFTKWNYCLPTNIMFGEGRLKEAGALAVKFGRKAFLVTGENSMKKFGITGRVQKSLNEAGAEVILYDSVESNPSTVTVDRGADMARHKRCDVIVALGGGNAIDTAKAIASALGGMALAHTGVGAAHAIGMTIGGFFNTNHGATVGLLLPHVVEYNLSACKEKYSRISEIFRKESKLDCCASLPSVRQGAYPRNDSSRLPDIIRSLMSDIGLPSRLRDLGVMEDKIPDMVGDTMVRQKDDLDTNPVMPARDNVERLYRMAF